MVPLDRYRALFAVPHVRSTLGASVVGRMPIGIAGLAILLFVQGRSNSFVEAGTASALYVLGLGVVAPFLGRLIDRLGPARVLFTCGFLYPAALIALAWLVLHSAHPAFVGAAALFAGASLPPVTACMRALYSRLVSDPSLLHTAYSVDSAVVEAVFILGPAFVAACVAVGHPEGAVLLAAFSAAIGSQTFARAQAVRAWSGTIARGHQSWFGVLAYSRLLVVFGVTLLYSIAFGLFEVAVTAHAAAKGSPAAAGIALALASLGSGAAALVYGSRRWRAPLTRQLILALCAMAAGIALLVPIDRLGVYAVACIASGVPMATVIATQSSLIAHFAPRERLAESFTWGSTCLLTGISAGIALGGAMAEGLAAYWQLVAAVAATAAAALLAAATLKD
ncbi:MAG: MFS transporter [Burkholderiales bacterium]